MITESGRENYVLVTAAYNEENCLEHVLKAVVAQTVPPTKWVIVDDASTDHTAELVEKFAAEHPFIQLHRVTTPHARNFHARIKAINLGCELLADLDFAYLGNLDADVTFEPEYFSKLIAKFGK